MSSNARWVNQNIAEVASATLVLIEIVMLFSGVVFRYVLNSPLIWVDELGEILFLWLVCVGAVVALRRNEHMRMTILVARLPLQLPAVSQSCRFSSLPLFSSPLLCPATPICCASR